MKTLYKKINILYWMFALVAIFALPSVAAAEDSCLFASDLTIGSTGDDVRCLQKFLNDNGYIISSSGPGSVGKETNLFREKTAEAVKKWQEAMSIYPATGTFGPLSRATYLSKVKKVTVIPTTTSTTVTSGGTTIISPLGTTQTPVVTPTPTTIPVTTSTSAPGESTLKKLLKNISEQIKDASELIDDTEDDNEASAEEIADMKELLDKAEDKFVDAVILYIDGEFEEATIIANKAKKYAENSVEDISDERAQGDADDAIADAKEAITQAREDISDAEDDDEDTDEARDFYDDARSMYDDAREAYDDEDYADAEELAQKAEKLAEDASDAL